MKWPIETVELELTTRCNAACPQCSRNYYGGRTWPTLPLVDLDLAWLQRNLDLEFLAALKQVRLVGTYGEPCMVRDFLPIVRWLKSITRAQIFISTNGSLRTQNWWRQLASSLDVNDRVMFGIDGMEDTNHLYRRGTSWKTIINNLKAFNETGGKSIWQFIVFQHNQHQVEEARALSTQLGCYGFVAKLTNRFVNKKHEQVDAQPVLDKGGKLVYWLKLPTLGQYQNQGYNARQQAISNHGSYPEYIRSTKIDCVAKKTHWLTISAEGLVLPCGFLQDRLYGHEAESHPDRQKLLDMIDQGGGMEKINLNHTKISDIVAGEFFQSLQSSWRNDQRLERCASMCGEFNRFHTSYDEIVRLC